MEPTQEPKSHPDLEASEKFELYRHPTKGWYCRYQCKCHSTLSSGTWQVFTGAGKPGALVALAECLESYNLHMATSPNPVCQR